MKHGSERTIAFFNNKGGVGKTTLTCNFAHHVSVNRNSRVLVVDLDPQANATQLLLSDEQWSELYEDEAVSESKTVLKVFENFLQGDSTVVENVELVRSDRFEVDVLAGHPGLSRVEDVLSSAWSDFKGEMISGARRSNWLTTLRKSLGYDFAILDLGPSLGALNRSALIGSTHFVTPMAADLFSLYALENLGDWMADWVSVYEDSMRRTVAAAGAGAGLRTLQSFEDSPRVLSGYLGYTVQQYVTKRSGGELRPTQAYDRYKKQIPERAQVLREKTRMSDEQIELGVVPNMFSMIPMAQSVHAPIAALEPRDGVRGAQTYQHSRYVRDLGIIFSNILDNLDEDGGS